MVPRTLKIGLSLAAVLLAGGCPGELPARHPEGGSVILDNGPWGGDTSIKPQDNLTLNTDAILGDTGPLPDAPPSPDSATVSDLIPVKPDSPASGTAGGPCPCLAPLLCVDKKFCRAQCSAPTGGCKATSSCPQTHACLGTDKKDVYVCLPGVAAGKPCSKYQPCYNKHVCAAVNYKPALCLPLCSPANSKCGASSKGTCLQSSSCLFCSSP